MPQSTEKGYEVDLMTLLPKDKAPKYFYCDGLETARRAVCDNIAKILNAAQSVGEGMSPEQARGTYDEVMRVCGDEGKDAAETVGRLIAAGAVFQKALVALHDTTAKQHNKAMNELVEILHAVVPDLKKPNAGLCSMYEQGLFFVEFDTEEDT